MKISVKLEVFSVIDKFIFCKKVANSKNKAGLIIGHIHTVGV